MFSDQYESALGQSLELCCAQPSSVNVLQPFDASDYVPLFWTEGFGLAAELDRAIIARSTEVKAALYGGRVFVIAPLCVTSICQERCICCNFRAGNKGVGVERRRLTDDELDNEALYLIEEKGLRVFELIYATDPRLHFRGGLP